MASGASFLHQCCVVLLYQIIDVYLCVVRMHETQRSVVMTAYT